VTSALDLTAGPAYHSRSAPASDTTAAQKSPSPVGGMLALMLASLAAVRRRKA